MWELLTSSLHNVTIYSTLENFSRTLLIFHPSTFTNAMLWLTLLQTGYITMTCQYKNHCVCVTMLYLSYFLFTERNAVVLTRSVIVSKHCYNSHYYHSVLRQVRSLFQSEFATKFYPMLPLSIFNTFLDRPVAAYVFFLVFPSLLSFPLFFLP